MKSVEMALATQICDDNWFRRMPRPPWDAQQIRFNMEGLLKVANQPAKKSESQDWTGLGGSSCLQLLLETCFSRHPHCHYVGHLGFFSPPGQFEQSGEDVRQCSTLQL